MTSKATTSLRGDEAVGQVLLDVDGVAERLSVSPRMVRKMIAERRIPHFKVGTLVRFDAHDVDEWLRASCRVEVID